MSTKISFTTEVDCVRADDQSDYMLEIQARLVQAIISSIYWTSCTKSVVTTVSHDDYSYSVDKREELWH